VNLMETPKEDLAGAILNDLTKLNVRNMALKGLMRSKTLRNS